MTVKVTFYSHISSLQPHFKTSFWKPCYIWRFNFRWFSLQEHGSKEITIVNPAQFPDRSVVSQYLEPMVLGTILTPDTYTGKIMTLCLVRGT